MKYSIQVFIFLIFKVVISQNIAMDCISSHESSFEQECDQIIENQSIELHDQHKMALQHYHEFQSAQSSLKDVKKYQVEETTLPSQILYIIFNYYRKAFEKLAQQYACTFTIGFNIYKVLSLDKAKLKICQQKITQKLNKIVTYNPINQSSKLKRVIDSPFFASKLKQNKIFMTFFNKKLITFTDQLTQIELRNKSDAIFQQKLIFSLPITPRILGQQDVQYYQKIIGYINKIFTHYQYKIEQNRAIAQVNLKCNDIYIIANTSKECMHVKLLIKSALQSMVVLVLKSISLNAQKKQKIKYFCSKISSFPIHVASLSSNNCMIISKDSIIQQLFNNKKFRDLLGLEQALSFGIIPIKFYGLRYKKDIYEKISRQYGYQLFNNKSVLHFKKAFHYEGLSRQCQPLKLIQQICNNLSSSRNRFQILNQSQNKTKYEQNYHNNQNSKIYIYLSSSAIRDQQLSRLLKRDVILQKVQMKKTFMIKYNCLENAIEINNIFWQWQQQKQGTCILQIALQDLESSKYFKGSKKVDKQCKLYKIQYIVTII